MHIFQDKMLKYIVLLIINNVLQMLTKYQLNLLTILRIYQKIIIAKIFKIKYFTINSLEYLLEAKLNNKKMFKF